MTTFLQNTARQPGDYLKAAKEMADLANVNMIGGTTEASIVGSGVLYALVALVQLERRRQRRERLQRIRSDEKIAELTQLVRDFRELGSTGVLLLDVEPEGAPTAEAQAEAPGGTAPPPAGGGPE